jgi:uncharacterized protein YndB with AHSA1/START domain
MMPVQSDEVVREVRIAAPPEDVFRYFTDPDKLVLWKAVTAELDARPGGRFLMDVTGRGDIARGEFLDIDPPHWIRFTWHWDNDQPGNGDPAARAPSVVEVTLTADGEGTLLRLEHRGIRPPERDASEAGWAHYLARLVLAAAGHRPGPDPWAGPRPGTTRRAAAVRLPAVARRGTEGEPIARNETNQ